MHWQTCLLFRTGYRNYFVKCWDMGYEQLTRGSITHLRVVESLKKIVYSL